MPLGKELEKLWNYPLHIILMTIRDLSDEQLHIAPMTGRRLSDYLNADIYRIKIQWAKRYRLDVKKDIHPICELYRPFVGPT